jgi:hypothetical protein
MNKSGLKANKAQLKEERGCLKDFQREKLLAPMTFDACTSADRKGRVQKAMGRTAKREDKKCDPLDVPPPFAYTSSATVNAAAVDGAMALTDEIFGRPRARDTALVTRVADKKTAGCQLEMLKRAGKLEHTVLKELYKAKKRAIKDKTVDSDRALEEELLAVFAANRKIDRAWVKLLNEVDKRCTGLPDAPDKIFPGYDCGVMFPSLSDVEACAIAAARCEACLEINAFDGLDLDCDWADDQNNVNESCP